MKVSLNSTGDASPIAALLLRRILPDILGRRAWRSVRLPGPGAAPPLPPRVSATMRNTIAARSDTLMIVTVDVMSSTMMATGAEVLTEW